MERLIKYNTFKSMKNDSSAKINRTPNKNKVTVTEMTAFLKLLSEQKPSATNESR
jgi:hypothetical protein